MIMANFVGTLVVEGLGPLQVGTKGIGRLA